MPALPQTTVAKTQNGLWYTLRSALFWLGATVIVTATGPVLASLGACKASHVLIFKCALDWNGLSYSLTTGVLVAIGRFIQGYLAKPPPQGG